MVEYELYVYKDADKILREKGLLQEIEDVLRNIQRVSHREIQNDFQEKNWEIEIKGSPQYLVRGKKGSLNRRWNLYIPEAFEEQLRGI